MLERPTHRPVAASLQVVDWGRTHYRGAWQRQAELVAQRLAGTTPDTLVFTEHEPVFTLGVRREAARHLVWPPATCAARGIAVVQTNRGGDITYHGPGQIVGYPILDLSAHQDLHAYLRLLEQVLIDTTARYGLTAQRRPGLTGIWVGTRKLAAIGIAVKRWVSYHGFALNVSPDLSHFAGIVPCGIEAAHGTVTSLAAELGPAAPDLPTVRNALAEEFARHWAQFGAGLDQAPEPAGKALDVE
jgi:lipoyl(octanoyl) transferase